jgi:hypothetical protein
MNGSSDEQTKNRKTTTMAHMIEDIDRVYSNQGTEWHDLAIPTEVIDEEVFDSLSHDIIESPVTCRVEKQIIALPNHKILVADLRKSRPDLPENKQFAPLHVPKNGYKVINNREVIDCMKESFAGLDVKITTAGTLEGAKKFFVSVDIGDSDLIINKDSFKAYVNFITGHDGTLAMTAYDSVIRIVCMNTLMASRQAAGEVGFSVYHTKNADLAMKNLPELFNAILKGRANLKEVMEYLEGNKCDHNDALAMAAGYFCLETDKAELSTRAMNAAQGIATLFTRGIGNKGETLYDLANGATEYWTSGEGTGKGKTSAADRTYRSVMGSAATHKEAFVAMLANDDRRKDALKIGKQAIALSLAS